MLSRCRCRKANCHVASSRGLNATRVHSPQECQGFDSRGATRQNYLDPFQKYQILKNNGTRDR